MMVEMAGRPRERYLPPLPTGEAALLRNLSAVELDALVEDWDHPLGEGQTFGRAAEGHGGGGFAGIHIVHTVLRDMLLGQDASQVESLCDLMLNRTLAYGQKGVVIMAISGVDLALLDVRGRSEGLSCESRRGDGAARRGSFPAWCRQARGRTCCYLTHMDLHLISLGCRSRLNG